LFGKWRLGRTTLGFVPRQAAAYLALSLDKIDGGSGEKNKSVFILFSSRLALSLPTK